MVTGCDFDDSRILYIIKSCFFVAATDDFDVEFFFKINQIVID